MAVLTQARPSIANQWPKQGEWTYEDWVRLPEDGARYEVIDGVLNVSPPPTISHQTVSTNLFTALSVYVRERGLGRLFAAPTGVRLPQQPVPLLPDIVLVLAAHLDIIGSHYIEGVPDLVVEILSPGNWLFDRYDKFLLYQAAGVPEYWIVDYRTETVEIYVWEKGEYVLQVGRLQGDDTAVSQVLPGFQVEVSAIFQGL